MQSLCKSKGLRAGGGTVGDFCCRHRVFPDSGGKAAVGMDCLLPVEQRSMESDRMEKETRYLTFALTKGRLAKKTLELLEQIGITCEEMKDPDSRKLFL